MIKTIYAEFDSYDSADFVAQRIRLQVAGIRNICVSRKMNQSASGVPYEQKNRFAAVATAATTYNYFTHIIPQYPREDEVTEPFEDNSVVMSIICDEASYKTAEKIVTAMGGESVRLAY